MEACRWKWCGLVGLLSIATSLGCSEPDPLDFGGPRDCSIPSQNEFAYRLMREAYLWNEHVPEDVDYASYEGPAELVSDLRYTEFDRWSRVSDLATTDALFEEGMVIGLGFRTRRLEDDSVVFAFVDPLSPAGQAGLQRGDRLVGVGAQSTADLDASDGWDDVFGPNEPGITVPLVVASGSSEADADTASREVSVTKDWYPLVTVPHAEIVEHDGAPVGYLFFTTFVEPSIDELNVAFERFNEAGVRQLVVDFRYNGGGRISAARHLMNLLVAGFSSGVAYRSEYSAALSDANASRDLSRSAFSLPALDHVVFITTGSTASASELVINAVLPYTQVSIVGGRSAGKPVGSAQWEFCDKAAHPITFRLLNARDEGNYFEGFAPTCDAPDDLSAGLGDPMEASMLSALSLLAGESCPPLNDEDENENDDEGEAEARPGPRWANPPPELRGAYPGLDELRGLY